MKKYQNKKSGFTLIELSIIILILGLLIVGTTKGLKVVADSKVQTARSLTNSSPVHSISKLALWYDATSETAFDVIGEGLDDGGYVTTWRDMNQQSITKYDAEQTGADSLKPKYTLDAMNGLPALLFDGTDDVLNTSWSHISDTYTLFLVAKTVGSDTGFLISSDATSNNGIQINLAGTDLLFRQNYNNGGSDELTILTGFSAVTDHNNPFVMSFFQQGVTKSRSQYVGSITTQTDSNGIDTLYIPDLSGGNQTIGGRPLSVNNPLNFYIGELIAFNKRLTEKEITSINNYLIQKWKIK